MYKRLEVQGDQFRSHGNKVMAARSYRAALNYAPPAEVATRLKNKLDTLYNKRTVPVVDDINALIKISRAMENVVVPGGAGYHYHNGAGFFGGYSGLYMDEEIVTWAQSVNVLSPLDPNKKVDMGVLARDVERVLNASTNELFGSSDIEYWTIQEGRHWGYESVNPA